MLNPDYKDILSAFIDNQVEFLLVGAHALAVHGLPRATGDMDLWVRPSPANASRVRKALEDFGAPLDGLARGDLAGPGTVFQIGVAPRRIDILTSLDGVGFEEAWDGRIEVDVEGLRLPVIGRREFLINKEKVGRPQDLADAARLRGMTGLPGRRP